MDLTPHSAALAKLFVEPKFRTMVVRAAKRLLKTHGVDATIPEPGPLGSPDEPD